MKRCENCNCALEDGIYEAYGLCYECWSTDVDEAFGTYSFDYLQAMLLTFALIFLIAAVFFVAID